LFHPDPESLAGPVQADLGGARADAEDLGDLGRELVPLQAEVEEMPFGRTLGQGAVGLSSRTRIENLLVTARAWPFS